MKYILMIYNWFAPFINNLIIAGLVMLVIFGLIAVYVWFEDVIDSLYR